jgi:ribonuclease HII
LHNQRNSPPAQPLELSALKIYKKKFIVAIDEVGRGCVAGPVSVAATLWVESSSKQQQWQEFIKDSKKLSAPKRENLFQAASTDLKLNGYFSKSFHSPLTMNHENFSLNANESLLKNFYCTHWNSSLVEENQKENLQIACLGASFFSVSNKMIDTHDIWICTQLAANFAMRDIFSKFPDILNDTVLLMDGKTPLKVFKEFLETPQICVVQGDNLFKSIGLSSVLAKHTRDNYMNQLCHSFPGYNLSKHKGYGTKLHMESIRNLGILPIHRETFLTRQS